MSCTFQGGHVLQPGALRGQQADHHHALNRAVLRLRAARVRSDLLPVAQVVLPCVSIWYAPNRSNRVRADPLWGTASSSGPVRMHSSTLEAMATPAMTARGAEFRAVMTDLNHGLRHAFNLSPGPTGMARGPATMIPCHRRSGSGPRPWRWRSPIDSPRTASSSRPMEVRERGPHGGTLCHLRASRFRLGGSLRSRGVVEAGRHGYLRWPHLPMRLDRDHAGCGGDRRHVQGA